MGWTSAASVPELFRTSLPALRPVTLLTRLARDGFGGHFLDETAVAIVPGCAAMGRVEACR